jgi:hypothetical protein
MHVARTATYVLSASHILLQVLLLLLTAMQRLLAGLEQPAAATPPTAMHM